jgi:hypothetical protein
MNDNLYQEQPTSQPKTTQNILVPKVDNKVTSSANTGAGLGASMSILIALLAFGLFVYITLQLLRRVIHRRRKLEDWKKTVFIEVSVPKETAEQNQKDGGNNSSSGGQEKNTILAVGEQLYSVMRDYAKPEFTTWLTGGDRFSLEIVCVDQVVKFWIACTYEAAHILERQVVAIYPKAHITRLSKIDFFKEKTVAYSQEIGLLNRHELPFKTYKLIDGDPLNTITNTLSGLSLEESVAIQLILVPAKDGWQKHPRHLAGKIQQGFNPNEILRKKGWWEYPFRFLGQVIKAVRPAKDDKNKDGIDDREQMDLSGKRQSIQLTPQQQEIIKKLEEKSARPGFHFTIRVVGSAKTIERSRQIVNSVLPAFQIFDIKPFNGLVRKNTNQKKSILNFLLRAPTFGDKKILNTEEINSLWHLPNYLTQTPNIKWLLARRPAIPLEIPGPGPERIFIGRAASRGQTKDVYINTEDRFRHIYSLGGSGSGKSVTMMNIALKDIELGHGCCIIDPHGEGVDDILRRIPENRIDDVIVFSPAILDRPLGLNMLEFDPLKPTQKTLVIDTLFSIWDKLYDLKKTGGPMFESYMKNSMRLVMSHPESGSTLMEIPKVLSDEDYRSFKLAMCEEQEVVDFWEKEATKAGGEASLENMVPYITSKLAPFVTNDFLRPMIGQQKSAINFRQAMDNNKIILVSLSKGMIGETSAYLVGMVIVGGLLMSGMGRSDGLKYNLDGTTSPVTPNDRPPFFVYIDEMQNFLFDAIPKALEEIRKYKVGFYLAHQFIKQVVVQGDERIKDSIMANCATKFIFRCSAEDAKFLEPEFTPLTIPDIANPEARTFNCIELVDGQRTTPFNVQGYYPEYFEIEDKSHPEKMVAAEEKRKRIIENTKIKYGRPKEEVEQEIKDRAKLLF